MGRAWEILFYNVQHHPCQIHFEIQGLMEPDTQGKMGILLDVLQAWGPGGEEFNLEYYPYFLQF